jgi:gamma-glutamylcyclotransferase (GGCT)/AIG2-like uncharacterized protein YtfP
MAMPSGAGISTRATPARKEGMARNIPEPRRAGGAAACRAPSRPVDLYFAYGSNMSSRRLLERAGSARARGRARLRGMRLALNKRGRDGSAKANLVIDARAEVWGVVFEIDSGHWPALDRYEWGYARRRDEVWQGETRVGVQLYTARAPFVDPGLHAFDWYRDFLVEGAREHALPEAAIAQLLALPVVSGRRAGPRGTSGSDAARS